MVTKTIKNVDEYTWMNFKILAAKTGINMAILLRIMVKEFEKNNKKFWGMFFTKGKILSNGEAKDMLEIVKNLRKERGFRE